MNNQYIRVIQEKGIYYAATESEVIQVSGDLAAHLTDKNQAQICGILRRAPEITPDKLAIIDRWCRAIGR